MRVPTTIQVLVLLPFTVIMGQTMTDAPTSKPSAPTAGMGMGTTTAPTTMMSGMGTTSAPSAPTAAMGMGTTSAPSAPTAMMMPTKKPSSGMTTMKPTMNQPTPGSITNFNMCVKKAKFECSCALATKGSRCTQEVIEDECQAPRQMYFNRLFKKLVVGRYKDHCDKLLRQAGYKMGMDGGSGDSRDGRSMMMMMMMSGRSMMMMMRRELGEAFELGGTLRTTMSFADEMRNRRRR